MENSRTKLQASNQKEGAVKDENMLREYVLNTKKNVQNLDAKPEI